MRDHRDLEVWQRAMDLAVDIYHATEGLPPAERYGLCAQIRRAAVSIPSNIAEGAARRTTRDFLAFVHIARGSLAELETQMLLATRIGMRCDMDSWPQRLNEVGRLMNGLIRSLRNKAQIRGR